MSEEERRTSDLSSLLKRRGFFYPSFEIYGGVAGFYDMGPLGSLLRENIEKYWKDVFIHDEGFLFVNCPSITPEVVFKNSGHLDKFSDILVRCRKCSDPFRADHLLQGYVENPDSMNIGELDITIREADIKCPTCGGELGALEEFNLMFKTFIGPGNDRPAYLRPETAQSIFLDFALLYRSNREKMPFGVAQIGKGFRNEISPRQGLLRQREFHMAEGEFFYDPEVEIYSPFERYRDIDINFVPNFDPETTLTMKLGESIEKGLISSEYLANFLGVTYSFAKDIGIPEDKMRFRQHMETEMAHYARDCWDLEVNTSYGWIEMVGVADRSAYDLTQHGRGSGQDMTAMRKYARPLLKRVTSVEVNMKILGPVFRGKASIVKEAIERMNPNDVKKIIDGEGDLKIDIDGETVEIPKDSVSVIKAEKNVTGERYIPHVVEPSFGIDRLMVAIIEHSYFEAEKSPLRKDGSDDEGPYRVMRFKPGIAPVKCGVFPLMNKDGLPEIASAIERDMRKKRLNVYYDPSGSIGRRYARMDEIGTPYAITVDYDSKVDNAATLRERDTGIQKRIPISRIPDIVRSLVIDGTSFDDLEYPVVAS